MGLRTLALVVGMLGAVCCIAQVPAPAVEWEPWRALGVCGSVEYQVSVTKEDGRNELRVRLKARNLTDHEVATRFQAILVSSEGDKQDRKGGAVRINPRTEVEGSSFDLGLIFETPVNAVAPVPIARIEFPLVETADLETPPPSASPSTYLDPFRDFPKAMCTDLKYVFPTSRQPRFMQLTNECYARIPRWTDNCQAAVEEIMRYARTAPESEIPCLRQWRAFQQCYGVYAYGPNPNPKPECLNRVPRCNLR